MKNNSSRTVVESVCSPTRAKLSLFATVREIRNLCMKFVYSNGPKERSSLPPKSSKSTFFAISAKPKSICRYKLHANVERSRT